MTKDLNRVPETAEDAAKFYKRSTLAAILLWFVAVFQLAMGILLETFATAAVSGIIFAFGVMFMAQAFDMRHWYHRLREQ